MKVDDTKALDILKQIDTIDGVQSVSAIYRKKN